MAQKNEGEEEMEEKSMKLQENRREEHRSWRKTGQMVFIAVETCSPVLTTGTENHLCRISFRFGMRENREQSRVRYKLHSAGRVEHTVRTAKMLPFTCGITLKLMLSCAVLLPAFAATNENGFIVFTICCFVRLNAAKRCKWIVQIFRRVIFFRVRLRRRVFI